MQHDRQVSPGDCVDLLRPDPEGDEVAYPNRALSVVVYTKTGGWLGGWEQRYKDSRPDLVCFRLGSLPDVVVAWERVAVERIHDHASLGLIVFHFSAPRFESPDYLHPSMQRRLLAFDDSTQRGDVKPRNVTRLGRPFKDPDAPTQVDLFGSAATEEKPTP